jgi:hypothetical protein
MRGEFRLVIDGRQRVDANHRVDGRHRPRDVAHIGRSSGTGFPLAEIGKRASQILRILAVECRNVLIVIHLGIRLIAAGDRNGGAGRQAAGLKAAVDPGPQISEPIQRLRTNDVLSGSMGSNDVRS